MPYELFRPPGWGGISNTIITNKFRTAWLGRYNKYHMIHKALSFKIFTLRFFFCEKRKRKAAFKESVEAYFLGNSAPLWRQIKNASLVRSMLEKRKGKAAFKGKC